MVRAIGKRKKFIFNAFVDFKPMQRFENRGDVTEFLSLNRSPGKRVLNNLKTIRRWFSRLLRHPVRKRSGSILTTA